MPESRFWSCALPSWPDTFVVSQLCVEMPITILLPMLSVATLLSSISFAFDCNTREVVFAIVCAFLWCSTLLLFAYAGHVCGCCVCEDVARRRKRYKTSEGPGLCELERFQIMGEIV